MHAVNAWQSPNVLAHKWGGGGGPPWGEFNGIEKKSVSRSVLKGRSGRLLGGFWEDFGRILGGFWKSFGKVLDGFGEDFEKKGRP